MFQDFVSLIFPQTCINCQRSLISAEQYICTGCKIDLPLTNDHQNLSNQLYQKLAFEPKVQSARAFLYFQKNGVTQKLLHQLKYKGKQNLGVTLGQWFAPHFGELEIDLIIPVPLHKSKLRKRSYNQSERIGTGIANELEVEMRTDLAIRQKATQTQTRKTKAERWVNLENVYSEIKEDLSGLSILVVDDVITTGATVGMLCQRLVEAGVDAIHVASIARGK